MNDSRQQFQDAVLYILGQIPKGKVISYGKIAKLAGYPNHSRHVGQVLKHLPKDTSLPWHRVINSQGKISFPTESDKYQTQLERLHAEDVILLKNKVNLNVYGWPPED